MIEQIREKAKELLQTKRVDLIIGYGRASDGVSAMSVFISKEEDSHKLIWDSYCVYNLSNYLKEFPGKNKGLIAKSCDVNSIIVLLQENQLKREEVFIIGVECLGVIDEKRLGLDVKKGQDIAFAEKCKSCKSSIPLVCDYVLKDKEKKEKLTNSERDKYESIRKGEAKSIEERSRFWQEEFSKCIRCYACRQICPMCYCPKCVADQTMPAWFSKATSLEGNFSWNVTRAMHLAGRCIDCGECERACPVGIPLREINKKIEKDIKELFNYEAGSSIEQKPLFACFDKDDPAEFIK
jgi:ferredoxin